LRREEIERKPVASPTTTEGTNLVNPWLDFSAEVATTSPNIAIARKSQFFTCNLLYGMKDK
jgi:hypothetical protein